MTEIIDRKMALALGLKRYFTGEPCGHGHIVERKVSSRACLACADARTKLYRAANPQKRQEHDRAYYAANREKIRERERVRRAANPDKIRKKCLAYYWAAPEKMREKSRAKNFKIMIALKAVEMMMGDKKEVDPAIKKNRERCRAYYWANLDEMRKKSLLYNLGANREKIRERTLSYNLKRIVALKTVESLKAMAAQEENQNATR